MKKVACFWFLVLIIIFLQTSSKGDVVTYTMEITSGVAHTSGGYDGEGLGDLSFEGMFKLTIDYSSGYADLEDLNMTLYGPSVPPGFKGFDWSSLEGTFGSEGLYLSSPGLPGLDDNYLSGTFDCVFVFLQGTVHDDSYDDYQYDCTINAAAIPEPATLLLLSFGGLALLRNRK